MSKRVLKLRALQDDTAVEDFTITAADAVRQRSHSSTPSTLNPGQTVSVDEASTDRRRIRREAVTFPTPATADAAPTQALAANANDPPLTAKSIPDWAAFFREDDNTVVQPAEASALEEHARRYLNSVSALTFRSRDPWQT